MSSLFDDLRRLSLYITLEVLQSLPVCVTEQLHVIVSWVACRQLVAGSWWLQVCCDCVGVYSRLCASTAA
jgi:hypothetical protein